MSCKTAILFLLTACMVYPAIPTADTVTNSIGMKFKRIPAGTFQMGFEGDSLKAPNLLSNLYFGLYDEHPRHAVTLTQPFYMGVYEVKISEFKKFNSHWPERLGIWDPRGDTYPVHSIGWAEADSFCKWLTANDPNGYTYRLATEAEWEYACRAGTATLFYTGDTITTADGNLCPGWGCNISPKAAGSYPPNPWGLFDMAGNAMEWCLDWYGPYTAGPDTNPVGYDGGDYRTIRDGKNYNFGIRSAARGGANPDYASLNIGFRVVIADTGYLRSKPEPDTLSPYQSNVVQSRPVPGTAVTGETYIDGDGREFRRVRMTRMFYPSQVDTIVYVSSAPLTDVSVTDRKSAGLFVKALAAKFGVLYRISNRYELLNAGIAAVQGQYYITIIPDLNYVSGQPHPDAAYFLSRDLPLIALRNQGPVYYHWNQATGLTELGNGDLLMSVCSDIGENTFTTNQAAWRLRLGSSAWDSIDVLEDVPGFENSSYLKYDYRRGQLTAHSVVVPNANASRPFYRISRDNGATWTRPIGIFLPKETYCHHWNSDGLLEFGLDTMVRVDAATGNLFLSYDGGYNQWTKVATAMTGIEHAFCILDNGSLLFFNRGDNQYTDVAAKWILSGISAAGVTTSKTRSPFTQCCSPGSHNGCVGLIKLFSGRLLRRTAGPTAGVRSVGESVDQGATWLCRWLPAGGNGDILQTRDGLIHFGTEMGRLQGWKREYVVSEQWLREQACRDISEWGVNEPGMVSDCEETEPGYFDSLKTGIVQASRAELPGLTLSVSPNPFNPSAIITLTLPGAKPATLRLLDARGCLVRSWPLNSAGNLVRLTWDGTDNSRKPVTSGVYIARLTADGKTCTRQLLLNR